MPRTTARTILAITLCLLLRQPAPADEMPTARPEAVGMSSDELAHVTAAMQQFVDDQNVAGAVTIAARRGKIVFFEAVGKRNLAADQPMTRDTIFRIYSMTKPLTSVTVLMLAEEGKLALDDPVAKLLPELKDIQVFAGVDEGELQLEAPRRDVTIRDLLRHTAGLTYGFFGDTEVDRRYRQAGVLSPAGTLADMTGKLGGLPLLHQPGARFTYSVSTDVLGRVVEVASGQNFDDFLEERIFTPLDLGDTGFHVPEEKRDRFAANYGPDPAGGLRVIDDPQTSPYRTHPRLLSGGGGLVSTARDYVRFCQMLLNGGELDGRRLLKAETVAEMTRNQLPDEAYPISLGGPRPGVGFGLGFSVVVEQTDYTGPSPVGEYGWGGAASTHFWIAPGDELAVVALTQFMPYSSRMEDALKPLVYDAVVESSE